jgi:hypothetical protein
VDVSDQVTYSEDHPHGPADPEWIAPNGSCALCARSVAERAEAEIERLSLRQLTLYDVAGEEVFTMTIGPRSSRWRAAENKPIDTPIVRIEID